MDKLTQIKIDKVLEPLQWQPVQVYYNETLQVIDVLEWILKQVGEARVWQTTFSLSVEYLSRLYQLRLHNAVNITEHIVVMDDKATTKTIKLWQFISQVIPKVYLTKSHAKFTLVEAASGQKVTLLTSQNLTRGNRYESAVVLTSPAVFDRLKAQLLYVIKYKSRPFHELYRGTIEKDTTGSICGDVAHRDSLNAFGEAGGV